MKIFKVLFVAIIALGMVACNNDDVPQVPDGPEATVSVRVVPTSNGPSVKMAGDISTELVAESDIKQLEVFIFSGGLPDGYGSASVSGEATTVTQVLDISTHAGPKTFYVVANANIGAVATEADLLKKTKEIPVVVANGLPMTSEGMDVTLVAGENQYGFSTTSDNYKASATQHSADTPASLIRVNARVAIKSATLSTNLPADQIAIFDALADIQVAMFNVPKTSNLFGATLALNANFLFGEAWPTTAGTYIETGTAEETFKATGLSLPIIHSEAPYFYVTENTCTEAKEQMFIVLRGKPTKGGVAVLSPKLYTDENGYTYYPVWVNAAKDGYTYDDTYTADSKIVRNTQYNISLTINGIGNPSIDPMEEAFLDVNVTVEPWKVVNQTVVW